MSAGATTSPEDLPINGVFVMGMYESGVDLVQDVFRRLGLYPVNEREPGPLSEFHSRLLEAVGGSKQRVPAQSSGEIVRILTPFMEEGRHLLERYVGSASDSAGRPWVWADPLLSVLAPFWQEALGLKSAVVLVHRGHRDLWPPRSSDFDSLTYEELAALWDRYNRAAMAHCFESPAAVLSYDSLCSQAKVQVALLAELLECCGIAPLQGGIEEAVEALEIAGESESSADSGVFVHESPQHQVLDRILEEMDGLHIDVDQWRTGGQLLRNVASFYDEQYYGASYDQSGVPYSRDQALWVNLFAAIAGSIKDTLHPRSVLDVGCATGILVEALRERGVDARGVDVSPWAIAQVPSEIRSFFSIGSITDELDGQYDLITCSEVLEHIPSFLADDAIANLCRHGDNILFSSTPEDFDEPSHLNVQSPGYWAQIFYRHGFVRDFDFDASFLTPHAVLYRRSSAEAEELIDGYERATVKVASALGTRLMDAVAEHDRLASRFNSLAGEHQALTSANAEMTASLQALRDNLESVESRRWAELLAVHEQLREHERLQLQLSTLVEANAAELARLQATKTLRYTALLRRFYGKLRRPFVTQGGEEHSVTSLSGGSYELWIQQFDTLDDDARSVIKGRIDRLHEQPLVSILMPTYNTPLAYLKGAIDSVKAQLYGNWELCIADDGSTESHVTEILSHYAAQDPRIKLIMRTENGHISAASNSALEASSGTWIALLDHDDLLSEHALALAVLALSEHERPGLLYSDEDKVDSVGRRYGPYFKPDFDPLLLLGQNYLTHLSMLRRDLVAEVGGYREGFEGSQDWDLVLRVSELLRPEQIVHVPHVLYHWRSHGASTAAVLSAKPYAAEAGRQAVVEHLERRGLHGDVTQVPLLGHNRVKWRINDPPPLVSIVIPTRDGEMLQRCIDSVLSFTTYPHFEIVVVDNGSRQLGVLDYLRTREKQITILRDERPFNFSALNNAAVQQTSGSVICLLNDDTEVISGDWLDELVGQLLQPGVGAAGAKLYYSDGRIQHAGIVLGVGGVAGHSHKRSDRLSPGYFGRLLSAQNFSAVTAACMAVRREAWSDVGGLDEENLAIAFNDVDFGLRLREAGWRVVWTPYAELFHHESVSRGSDTVGDRVRDFGNEARYMEKRWSSKLRYDPAYNPNLSLVTEDFSLAWPPRVSYSGVESPTPSGRRHAYGDDG